MRDLSGEFQDGTIEGADFADSLNGVKQSAADAFNQLDAADRVHFSGAISEVDRLGSETHRNIWHVFCRSPIIMNPLCDRTLQGGCIEK